MTINSLGRIPILACILIGLQAFLAGCEDSAAQAREAVHGKIVQASSTLRYAGSDPGAETENRNEYEKVLTTLSSVSGGEPAQIAAAGLLTAEARLHLGHMDLNEARNIETAHRSRRHMIRSIIDSTIALKVSSDALASYSDEPRQRELNQRKAEAQDHLAALTAELEDLNRQIAEGERINAEAIQERDRLLAARDELYREFRAQGNLDGFPQLQEAIERQREAEILETQISHRQTELQYDHRAQQAVINSRAGNTQELISQIEQAKADLAQIKQRAAAEAQRTREALGEFKTKVGQQLDALQSERAEKLEPLYKSAISQFERSASDASGAVGRAGSSGAPSARLTAAHAQQALADAHASRARGLEDRAVLLTRLIQADHVADTARLQVQLTEVRQQLEEAIKQAQDALGAASESLNQMSGNYDTAAVAMLRSDLQMLQQSLAGEQVAWPRADGGAGAGAAQPTRPYGPGAASPEELATALSNAQGLEGMIRAITDYAHIPVTQQTRGTVATIVDCVNAVVQLDAALVNQFQTGLIEFGIGQMSESAPMIESMSPEAAPFLSEIDSLDANQIRNFKFDSVVVDDAGEDAGQLTITAMGDAQPVPIRRVNGRWYLDFEAMADNAQDMTPAAASLPPGMDVNAALMMAQQLIRPVQTTLNQLKMRVDDGEFASFDEFVTAAEQSFEQLGQQLMPQLMQQMGGPGGGMPGMPPGGFQPPPGSRGRGR